MDRRRFLAAGALVPATLTFYLVAAASFEEPTAADIGFCQDMSAHHLQALAMCLRVLGRDTGGHCIMQGRICIIIKVILGHKM